MTSMRPVQRVSSLDAPAIYSPPVETRATPDARARRREGARAPAARVMPPRFVRCHDTVLVRPLGPHAWLGRLPNGHELAVLLPRAGLAAARSDAAAGESGHRRDFPRRLQPWPARDRSDAPGRNPKTPGPRRLRRLVQILFTGSFRLPK